MTFERPFLLKILVLGIAPTSNPMNFFTRIY